MRDITQEKLAEHALLFTQERLLESQRLGQVGAWEWDVRTQSVWWSDQTYRVFGLEKSQAVIPSPELVLACVVPEDRLMVKRALSAAISGKEPYAVDYRLRRQDGAIRHVRSMARLDYDASGTACRLIGHIQDITERKQAEITLRRSEERLAESQKIAHVGAWEWDLQENRIWWSDELYRLFEQNPAVYTPSYPGLLDRIHPDDRLRVRKAFEDVFRLKRPCDIEARIVLPSGGQRTMRALSKVELDAQGNLTRFIGTAQDISESRQLADALVELNEQLEQRVAAQTATIMAANNDLQRALDELRDEERLRETFISALTHDLRTPLIGQQRALEFLEHAHADPANASADELTRLVQSMQMSNRDLLTLVNRLLEVYQFESGHVELLLAPVSLPRLIQQCFDELFSIAVDKGITLTCPASACGELRGDRALLKQVLMNLLGNALAWVPSGGWVTVSTEQTADTVTLSVCDNGPGVSAQAQEHLFEKFFIHEQTRKKIGSGLGLYICKMIVSLHDGTIAYDPQRATGATFVVTLPREGPVSGGGQP